MNSIKSFGTFSLVFLYRTMRRGNQHGGRKCDDLQNRLDMTPHIVMDAWAKFWPEPMKFLVDMLNHAHFIIL